MQPDLTTTQPVPVTLDTPPQGTCLIIEDSDFDQKKLTRIMQRDVTSMQIAVASTLSSARAALAQADADTSLILLDNNLPDGLGAEFAQELARDAELSQIPVIMVSDWPSPFMWQKAASAGVFYVVNKAEFDARYVHATLKLAQERRERMN